MQPHASGWWDGPSVDSLRQRDGCLVLPPRFRLAASPPGTRRSRARPLTGRSSPLSPPVLRPLIRLPAHPRSSVDISSSLSLSLTLTPTPTPRSIHNRGRLSLSLSPTSTAISTSTSTSAFRLPRPRLHPHLHPHPRHRHRRRDSCNRHTGYNSPRRRSTCRTRPRRTMPRARRRGSTRDATAPLSVSRVLCRGGGARSSRRGEGKRSLGAA